MEILITLTMKEINRYEIIKRLMGKKISEEEARKLMNLKSVRQVRRIRKRVVEDGAKGVVHRSRGKPGNRKFSQKYINRIIKLISTNYIDFKPTFAAEKLFEDHKIKINSESLRQLMIKEGLWKVKSRKRPKKRHVWRKRKDNFGEMEQFDGSYHHWFEDRGAECCLLLSVDDASGEITHAKFDHNEGVKPVFRFWLEYFEKHGFPISIYLDKFSTYKINHPLAVDNKDLMTQFQRAMGQVDIRPINAHSPEAKGRVERIFGTLQDRLVKELRLANINSLEAANEFLKTYIPKFNKQFPVVPAKKADLHRPVSKSLKKQLPRIFSIQSQRKVQNDYTILFKNQFFQLEDQQPTTVFKKDTVTVEEHLNGEIQISLNRHYLNYQVLPERPKKQNIPLAAITTQKSPWIPPADHPWKRSINFSSERSREKGLTSSQLSPENTLEAI
jgi:hypothetical protein